MAVNRVLLFLMTRFGRKDICVVSSRAMILRQWHWLANSRSKLSQCNDVCAVIITIFTVLR